MSVLVGSRADRPDPPGDVFGDLRREHERLESLLSALPDEAWSSPSSAEGWSVADVVLHLAQCEEAVVATIAGGEALAGWDLGMQEDGVQGPGARGVDAAAERMVRAHRDAPDAIFERWRLAHRAAREAMVAADPEQHLTWAAAPLKPATLATTRLAETWAHTLDIATPLGIVIADSDRLRHVAWLAQRTLPYAFTLAGLDPRPVHCVLAAADGTIWRFGPPTAASGIRGPVGAFCRVAAQRLPPHASGLVTYGPYGGAALELLRSYAA